MLRLEKMEKEPMENSVLPEVNMLILLEGVDGSGKTTLAKQLKERGYNVCPGLDRNLPEQAALYAILSYSNKTVILDRSFISEIVYRLNDDKTPNIKLDDAISILKNCKIIHCITETSFEDSIVRGEDNITNLDDHCNILDYYLHVLDIFDRFTDTKIFDYDWHTQSVDDVIKFIEEA